MNITIRMLGPEELEGVLELISGIFPDVNPDICEDDVVLVAESGGKTVGFAHAVEDERRVVLHGIGVEESARGNGIGSALIERMLQIFSGSDKPMVLKTTLSNPALELYNSFGFSIRKFGAIHLLERKCEN